MFPGKYAAYVAGEELEADVLYDPNWWKAHARELSFLYVADRKAVSTTITLRQ